MKTYQVWTREFKNNGDLDYDYDIEENEENSILKYSKSIDWAESVRGSVCANIENTGNGVKISIGKKNIKLDYSELIELKCLLMFDNESYMEVKETNTIKIIQ